MLPRLEMRHTNTPHNEKDLCFGYFTLSSRSTRCNAKRWCDGLPTVVAGLLREGAEGPGYWVAVHAQESWQLQARKSPRRAADRVSERGGLGRAQGDERPAGDARDGAEAEEPPRRRELACWVQGRQLESEHLWEGKERRVRKARGEGEE